ncbi:MAG: hypothetical protein ACRDSM_08770 [Pseudonocardiaceae bacterium]
MRRWLKGYAAWRCGTLRTVDRDGTIKLLAVILADLPKLDGAACRGRHELFDPIRGNGHRYQHEEHIRLAKAARICSSCPMVQRCPDVTTTAGEAA